MSRTTMTMTLMAATCFACQPDVARTEAPLVTSTQLVDGDGEEDAGWMPHLITDRRTIQTIAYESRSDREVRIATRHVLLHDSDGTIVWGPWTRETAFRETSNNLTKRDYAPYHAFFVTEEGQRYRWMTYVRTSLGIIPTPRLARRVRPHGVSGTGGGNCGENNEWFCYSFQGCRPFADDSYLPARRIPFVVSRRPHPEDPTLPSRVTAVWVTLGGLVASATLDPYSGELTCGAVGDPGGIYPEGVEVSAESIDLLYSDVPIAQTAGTHVFAGGGRFNDVIGYGGGLRQFVGSGIDWSDEDGFPYVSQGTISEIPGRPSASPPVGFDRGFGAEYSPRFAVAVSSPFPVWDSDRDCEEGSLRGYFYTNDGGNSWADSAIPALEGNDRVCQMALAAGAVGSGGLPTAALFFSTGADLRVARGTFDGSSWDQDVHLVASHRALDPSAVVEETEATFERPYAIHDIYTVAYYDPTDGALRVARGRYFE